MLDWSFFSALKAEIFFACFNVALRTALAESHSSSLFVIVFEISLGTRSNYN